MAGASNLFKFIITHHWLARAITAALPHSALGQSEAANVKHWPIRGPHSDPFEPDMPQDRQSGLFVSLDNDSGRQEFVGRWGTTVIWI